MTQNRILVIEDDDAIRTGVVDALRSEGYAVQEASDGLDGRDAALGAAYDLLLLDLIMPGCDGFEILQALRSERPDVPVIILTARGGEDERVRGLRCGADDYVVKPFSVRELLARVEAVLRRAPDAGGTDTSFAIPGGLVDFANATVALNGAAPTTLSEKELELLRYLKRREGQPVSRDELLTRVWGISARGIETRTVDVHIAHLREKLGDDSSAPRIILTIRGKGYSLAVPS